MLRPASSRLSITGEDIEKLKKDLASRPTALRNVKANDWFAVQASHQTQNSRPSSWYKGVLRPSTARRTDQLLTNNIQRPIYPVVPVINTSSDTEADFQSEPETDDETTTPATIAFSLAEARNAMDRAPGRTNVSAASASPRLIARFERGPESPFAGAQSDRGATERPMVEHFSHGYDGSIELSSETSRVSLRVGESDVGPPRQPLVPMNPGLTQHGTRSATAQMTHTTPLDPAARSFVPRVRFGSADEDETGNIAAMAGAHQNPRRLRARPNPAATADHPLFVPYLPQNGFRPQNAQFLRGRQYNHRERPTRAAGLRGGSTDNIVPISYAEREHASAQASGTLSRQNSHVYSLAPQPSIPYSIMPPTLPGYFCPPVEPTTVPRVRVSDRRQNPATLPTSASNSYSVPNFNHLADGPPQIHTRRGSLNWSRNNASVPVSERTHTSRVGHHGGRRGSAGAASRVTGSTTDTGLPRSFYLNFSPLDELTTGLRRFSGHTDRRSSGSSTGLRPFRGRLLSGSLFYSEDFDYEDQISPNEEDGEQMPTQSTVPPSSDPVYYSPVAHRPMPEPAVIPSSDILGLGGPVSDLAAYSPSSYNNSLPLPVTSSPHFDPTPSSPLPAALSSMRMSPVTSGPTYSIPMSSTSGAPMSSSPPIRENSGVAASSSPILLPPRTPRFRRGPGSPILAGHTGTRPAATPRFRIYDDDLPAAIQPQTPADVSRHRRPASNLPLRAGRDILDSDMGLTSHGERTSEPRPIFEPSTAELTTIPLLSPVHAVRRGRVGPRRRRAHQSASTEHENEIEASAIQGLEDERIAWMQRRGEAESHMRDGADLDDDLRAKGG